MSAPVSPSSPSPCLQCSSLPGLPSYFLLSLHACLPAGVTTTTFVPPCCHPPCSFPVSIHITELQSFHRLPRGPRVSCRSSRWGSRSCETGHTPVSLVLLLAFPLTSRGHLLRRPRRPFGRPPGLRTCCSLPGSRAPCPPRGIVRPTPGPCSLAEPAPLPSLSAL